MPSLSPLSEDFLQEKIFQSNLQEISKQVCCDIPLIAPPSNRTSSEVYCKISKKIECISEISVSQWLANLTQLSRRIYRQNLWFNKIEDSVKPSRIFQENTKHTENFMLFNFTRLKSNSDFIEQQFRLSAFIGLSIVYNEPN